MLAGRVQGAASRAQAIDLELRLRHQAGGRRERYAWIVNCTGPSFDKRSSRGLERQLLERGLLIADPLGLGYLTTANGTAFGTRGPVPGLHLLGPACRPRWWEHTAVPELRQQACALADELTRRQVVRAPAIARAAQGL